MFSIADYRFDVTTLSVQYPSYTQNRTATSTVTVLFCVRPERVRLPILPEHYIFLYDLLSSSVAKQHDKSEKL